MSLKSFLIRLIWICVLPLVIFAAYLGVDHVKTLQMQRGVEAANLARNYTTSLDYQIDAQISALQVLASSSSLNDPPRLDEVYQEATGFYNNFHSHVILADLSKHMIFNTRMPYGSSLPDLPQVKGRSSATIAMATGKPAVSDLFIGPVSKSPLISIAVPVMRNGHMTNLLLSITESSIFQHRLDEIAIPSGYSMAVLDGKGEIIAHRLPHGIESHSPADDSTERITVSSTLSPWSVVITDHRTKYRSPVFAAAAVLAASILVATFVSVLGGILASSRLARAVVSLAEPSSIRNFRPAIVEIETVRSLLNNAMTARETAESTLRENEERLQFALDATSDGLWDWDVRSGLVYRSPRYYKLIGRQPDEGYANFEFFKTTVHPDDLQRVMAEFEAHMHGKTEAIDCEYRLAATSGKVTWLRSKGLVVKRDTCGAPLRLVGTLSDITNRVLSDEQIKNLVRDQEAILNSFIVAFVKVMDRKFIWANQAFSRMFGYSQEEILGQSSRFLYPSTEEFVKFSEIAYPVIQRGDVFRTEVQYLRKDGTVGWYDVSGESLHEGSNESIWAIVDITERKRAEEDKTKLEAQLQQAQKMESVGRLAGGVAHDFNNMLSVILGYAHMGLMESDPSQPLHINLEEIRKAAERSADLTRQLLAFARKQTIAPKVLDLNETVAGMFKMLQRLIGEDIHITWSPESNLWPVKVDPSQIDQIMANLSVNARDAISGVGKITIETGNVTFDSNYCATHTGFLPGEFVLLAVSDDGCGMGMETQAHIFEPFFTTKEIGEGTGLGLATVFGIVKQNNGFINVYSETDHGTTFKIYLPRHEGKAGLSRPENAAKALSRGMETILLVEDELAILQMTTILLEKQGYTVLAVNTPGQAISLAGEYDGVIHLLLTDVVMSEMNGRDLAKKLLELNPHIKILFMSGYTANVIAHHGVLDEGVNFISKPFSVQDLSTKVREALEK